METFWRNFFLKYQNQTTALFVILFGISAWIQVNGLWVETPVLVQILPEGWNLTSYIVIFTQVANIGPLIYGTLKYLLNLRNQDKIFIHITYGIGTASCFGLIFYWKTTSTIFGENHSVVFLALTFGLAFVDCTTSVLYLPFMTNYRSNFLMYYFIGEGLSGVIPSFLSLIQGVQGSPECKNVTDILNGSQITKLKPVYPPPRFPVETFFILLTLLVVISWISFVFLTMERIVGHDASALVENETDQRAISTSESSLLNDDTQPMGKSTIVFLLVLQAFVCALTNGLLPGIQSYSCMPYGSLPYHLAVNLAVLSNPVLSWIAFFRSNLTSKTTIAVLSLLGTLAAAYIFLTALQSPNPPLANALGSTILICSWVIFTAIFSFVKASIARLLRSQASDSNRLLFWCGAFTQTGSFIGAVISFVLVNYLKLFVSYSPCAKKD